MEEEKALLRRIFGDSSDSEDKEDSIDDVGCQFTSDPNCPTWEPVNEIKGLWLCRDFLSPHQQSTLLSAIQNEGWFLEAPNNQAMRFGDLPSWAIELSNSIREVILYGDRIHEPPNCAGSDRGEAACWLPPDLLSREPFFDQLIANVYQPGEVRLHFLYGPQINLSCKLYTARKPWLNHIILMTMILSLICDCFI
ncbi:hypothetical protein OIU77_010759 [Salix suchowensis]|uniref:Uncharacterized protein n=1 Tax=Salix suchowensis TaxID=1278906 RepID=A0ABQ9AAM7_9ROSI|nr:hypothetical protein OIU77_010759 [Salix suchowensis]